MANILLVEDDAVLRGVYDALTFFRCLLTFLRITLDTTAHKG